ncbi:MAG TPA: DUF2304 domain-containing protein [Kiritimatiellia bacterium]|nr:DUF2304 domain-containing protein [Kiritimatiellia bacterium]HNR93378.1 DUF2304 domain-containing protein [Kiritimatiellia bacterium]HNS79912.1 DUF2304 domain-containing protein [Kiritimatiellia bacterium]HPA78100.1 DUF2304 domain-containing protein [Kiritimatiellia bacterium]HQQ03590.1 DUF2304 domain-containing protein [Kiritimatiellia bacterium]
MDINAYLTGWQTAIVPRILIGLLGLLIVLILARTIRSKRISLVPAILWSLAAAVLIIFSLFPQQLIRTVISTEYVMRMRIMMGFVSLLVLLITLESTRQARLQERYALLWVATALVILICAFFPSVVNLLRLLMGMNYTAAVVSVAFTFLTLVLFHFSISMSISQAKQARIAQKLALLETRVRELEERR